VTFEVGQIIYLLSRKDARVYPAQVIEEIKRKTIEEELISYIIRLPDENRSEVLIEEVNAEIFTSIKDLEANMIENAHNQIKSLLSKTVSLEKVFKPIISKQQIELSTQGPEANQDKVEIDLGNGMTGKINIDELPVRG